MYIYIYIYIYICISYNKGKSALPDIYALALWSADIYTWHPRTLSAWGRVHIYQAKYECLCYNSYPKPTITVIWIIYKKAMVYHFIKEIWWYLGMYLWEYVCNTFYIAHISVQCFLYHTPRYAIWHLSTVLLLWSKVSKWYICM